MPSSVESYTLALQQKYSFVELPQPAKEVRLQSVWMPQAFEEDGVQGRLLSYPMVGAIREGYRRGRTGTVDIPA